ncbi:cation transporter [Microbacterium sp. NPDC096154]|uniref:heavy-metal-associated domain-containing protein n=1 Tax=Microbacterium sp. NPDC096154 TaxID=3155549 RepID=UPI003328754D
MSTISTYLVQGMTCGHCARAVGGGIEAIEGVVRADVDVAAGTVTVEAAAPVADEAVSSAVAEAGYTYGGRA